MFKDLHKNADLNLKIPSSNFSIQAFFGSNAESHLGLSEALERQANLGPCHLTV